MGNTQPPGRDGDYLTHLRLALGKTMPEGEAEFSSDLLSSEVAAHAQVYSKNEAMLLLFAPVHLAERFGDSAPQ